MRPRRPRTTLERALFEIKRVIAGQDTMLERVLVCLLADGHLLIEGVPGLAKTLTIKTTAQVLGGTFNRIQFTPDLMPSDLVGTRIYRPKDGEFDVELGPVFCNFLLADEINRAPAKVQSALLEVMQERQVTIGKESFAAPSPFLVMATQNPIESEGTYPLPEAQVDRFMLKVVVGYPESDDELTVVQRSLAGMAEVRQILDLDALDVASRGGSKGLCRSRALALRSADRDCDARPRVGRPRRPEAVRRLRGEPARADLADDGRSRAGADPWARLRASAGRSRAGDGRAPPPHRPQLRGAGRRGRSGLDRLLRPGGRACAGDRALVSRGMTVTAFSRERTPDRPGPGPMPEALLRALDMKIGRRIDGLLTGEHRTAAIGIGTELAQIRQWEPGDDVRRIDWNATARSNEVQVRVDVAERALTSWVLLDVSPSMRFGTADRRKWDVAEGVAVALGHLASRRGNRIGVTTFGGNESVLLRPRQGRVGLLGVLLAVRREPETERVGPTSIGTALTQVARVARQRSLAVVVSDFRGPRDWRPAMLRIAARHAVVAVEIRDPREQELPNVGHIWLVDPETGRKLHVDTAKRKLRERFADAAAEERAGLGRELAALGVPHLVLSTSGDWLRPFAGFVSREGRRR